MSPRLLLFGLIAASACFGASSARADSGSGFALERHEPTSAGEWSFAVDHPWFTRPLSLAAGMTVDYAHKPLVLGYSDEQGFHETSAVVRHLLVGHFDVSASVKNRLTVTLSLPLILDESGTAAAEISPSGTALGDVRLGAMGRVYGQPLGDPFSLCVGLLFWAPTALGSNHAGDASVRVAPKMVLGGLWARHLLWSATAAIQYRGKSTIGNLPAADGNSIGSELQLGAAVAYADLQRRWVAGPELLVSSVITDGHYFERDFTSLEALLGAQHRLKVPVHLGVAAGLGLQREPGAPDFRVIARVAWVPEAEAPSRPQPAPVVSDRDRDGIPDGVDACPDEPGPQSADPGRHGCPVPPDWDRDGVADADDQCPEEPRGPVADPARRGCPARDGDGDKVFDFEDVCPDLAHGPTPDPKRPGCPDPDADGDGRPDSKDQCPAVAAGLRPDPGRAGCPLADRDGDSVPDVEDACPDQPGAPHSDPKKNGCRGLVELKGDQLVILQPVFFATNQDVILKKSFPVLQAVAEALKARSEIKQVSIEGHTDSRGVAARNRDLSRRRATSVMKWMTRNGIAAERLRAQGFGPD